MTEDDWERVTELASAPPLALVDRDGLPCAALLVVVAHPDDETLIAGGLIHDAARAGVPVTVLVATAGEASHPDSPTHRARQLRELRLDELDQALRVLHPHTRWRLVGLPDGSVADHLDQLTEQVAAEIEPGTMVVSTWQHDGHPDHEAVASACAAACQARGVRHLQAPLWAWAWQGPESLPWDQALRHDLSAAAVVAKELAIRAHRSQVEPLSEHPADAAVVSPEVLRHFLRQFEIYLEGSPPADTESVFDAMYDRGADPWRFEGSWYEERKRSVTLAALPFRRLGRVLEVGPATGLLTEPLAARADSLLALEVSPRAAEATRARLVGAGLDEVAEVRIGRVPRDCPAGPFDTIVMSEIAYFLTAQEWAVLLRKAELALAPQGALVLVHWMHPVQGWPLDGATAHDLAATGTALSTLVHHVEPDFELRVLRRPGLPTLAQQEGRV